MVFWNDRGLRVIWIDGKIGEWRDLSHNVGQDGSKHQRGASYQLAEDVHDFSVSYTLVHEYELGAAHQGGHTG